MATNKEVKCFDQEYRYQNLNFKIDLGVRPISLEKIVGSVGRCLDFDANFKLRDKHTQQRLELIKEALKKGIALPPIEVYKIKDEYYVRDGHHRVSAAKELRQKYIDASVIECLPPADSPENALYWKRFYFEREMGIEGIILSRSQDYDKLVWQIEEHQLYLSEKEKRNITLKEAARDWFYNIYQPLTERTKEEKLTEQLKDASPGNIYLYLSDQLQLRNRKDDHYLKFDEAMKELLFLVEEARILHPRETLGQKIKKILLPCYYLSKCPYYQ